MFVEYENVGADCKRFCFFDKLDFAGGIDKEIVVGFGEMAKVVESKEGVLVPELDSWILDYSSGLLGIGA